MKTFVVDASVGAKWASPAILEPLANQADRFLRDYVANKVDVLVPDLFWLEIGNFFWKAARRGTIGPTMAGRGFDLMLERNLRTVPSRTILSDAMQIALDFDRTIYDSTYVALAVAARCELLTADERLVNALASRLPVRWLGVY